MNAFGTKWATLTVLCSMICLPAVSQAATHIFVGDHILMADTPNQVVNIYVTGGDQIQAVNFRAQIGNDPEFGLGPVFQYGGGPGASTIIGPGTIFESNNVGMFDVTFYPALFEAGTFTTSGSVAAEGLLATLVIDTTGYYGRYPLILSSTILGPTDWAGSVFNGEEVPNPIIVDGTVGPLCPEPGSMALAAFGVVGLAVVAIRRRRRAR